VMMKSPSILSDPFELTVSLVGADIFTSFRCENKKSFVKSYFITILNVKLLPE
jgi:hypothetical protein